MSLALRTGAAAFDTLYSHAGWYADPVAWTRQPISPPGAMNPWPILTVLAVLGTLTALIALWRDRRIRSRSAIIPPLGLVAVLIATGVYFVPTLVGLADHANLTDAQIVEAVRLWITLNILRLLALLALFYLALVALGRMSSD
ncbi:hypothetical protein [Sphingomonas sp.]|uniref:hypothetical protein n=1 Tax=Sphingomonas sp. TaxID=28214 RepID=UPI002DEB9822|nr:hypothetical protein [Sphingomonas sp.]